MIRDIAQGAKKPRILLYVPTSLAIFADNAIRGINAIEAVGMKVGSSILCLPGSWTSPEHMPLGHR